MDFLLKIFFFCDCFNGHETHWTDQFSEQCPAFARKSYKGFCALSLPTASQLVKDLGVANTWAGLRVLLGLLTNGAPVHGKPHGGFGNMGPEISAFPTPYVPIS